MMAEGFLHKAFLGDHTDLPVAFVNSVDEVIPAIRAKLAAVPRSKLDEPVGARL
jgi:hypothetical protein